MKKVKYKHWIQYYPIKCKDESHEELMRFLGFEEYLRQRAWELDGYFLIPLKSTKNTVINDIKEYRRIMIETGQMIEVDYTKLLLKELENQ